MTKEQILEHWFPTPEGAEETHHILNAMSDYAQQQCIAFIKWAEDYDKFIGDNWGGAFIPIPDTPEKLYSQFIEYQSIEQQQNK